MDYKLHLNITNTSFNIYYKGTDAKLLKSYENFKLNKYQELYDISFLGESDSYDNTLNYFIKITRLIIKKIITNPSIEVFRENINIDIEPNFFDEAINSMPFMLNETLITNEYISEHFLKILSIFKKEISETNQTVEAYFKAKDDNLNVASRIYFHLVENKKSDEYPFAFLATYAKKDNQDVLHTPLEKALIEYKNDNDKLIYLLSSVTKAGEKSTLIKGLIDSGELFSPTYFTVNDAFTFFSEVNFYESLGIMCRLPKWQRERSNKASIKLNITKKDSISLKTILELSPTIHFGDEETNIEDLTEILNSDVMLVNYKNKWINTSKEELEKIINAFKLIEQNKDCNYTIFDLFKLEFNPQKELGIEADVSLEISQNEWLKDFKKKLSNPQTIEDYSLPTNLNATLRPYQQTGFNWLCKMMEFGLGACLADDMGLGKTLQVITLITKLYETDNIKTLLVVPSSLMLNWKKEFLKFSNIEPIIIHSSAGVKVDSIEISENVYITSYKMASKLVNEEFDLLVIDEAQAIKNVGTAQTKIIKDIKANYKIALTGTPIENNLGDLYSLFDFLNKGLLGTHKEFTKHANKLIEENNYVQLRNSVKPFILRRLKSDKTIINDLPEKLESINYVALSKNQVSLYKKEVQFIEELLKGDKPMPKAFILSSIMKFKQICNHPSQFLNDGKYTPSDSGKFENLKIIAESVKENKEQMLVFTQFKEMTEPLAEFLESIFDEKGLIIHGSTSVKNRDLYVSKFNSDDYVPFMVLSLKAGGTGLNLVSANHVVHFDRWWNPAIENQATDRAFRIGQTKNVNIYKFICNDTIEEKIDQILNTKQAISDNILESSNEAWISKLNKQEILNLFKYGGK